MNSRIKQNNKGFSLVELLVSLAILTLVGTAISTFQRDMFTLSFSSQANLSAQLDARHLLKQIVSELREAAPSSLGAYPLAVTGTSSLTFYTDLNNDGVEDRVRYYISGKKLMKGTLLPSGNPLAYVDANERLSTAVTDVVNSTSTPIFQYYDSNYTGTSSPLTQPVSIPTVRLIKINVIIDKDPNKSPNPITVTTEVDIRNLKDNY